MVKWSPKHLQFRIQAQSQDSVFTVAVLSVESCVTLQEKTRQNEGGFKT